MSEEIRTEFEKLQRMTETGGEYINYLVRKVEELERMVQEHERKIRQLQGEIGEK